MLKKPDFPYPEIDGKRCVSLEDGKFRVSLDRNAAIELLFSLYAFATTQPLGEEIDIRTSKDFLAQCKGKTIGFCELNLMPSHVHKKQGKDIMKAPIAIRNKPHGVYTEEHDRLDYFVSVEEISEAYEALSEALSGVARGGRIREAILFGTLFVRIVMF